MNGAEDPEPRQGKQRGRRKVKPPRHHWHMFARFVVTLVVLMSLGFGVLAVLALSGRTVSLPVWAVAEVEDRLNATIRGDAPPGTTLALSLGGVEIVVPDDWVPRFKLADVRLREPDGQTLLTLPEARIAVDPGALARGQLRPRSLALVGARLSLRRIASGQFDLASDGAGARLAKGQTLGALFDAGDTVFQSPALSALMRVDVEGLSLTVSDARAGRTWELGDGRLVIERRPDALAGELSVTLIEGGRAPALATITVETALKDGSARMSASLTGMAADDVASLAAPLSVLSVLDAPISGRIAGNLDSAGRLAGLEGELDLGAGALRPEGNAEPLAFEKAGLSLAYDPVRAAVTLRRLAVESRSVRLNATGRVYLLGSQGGPVGAGALPQSVLAQIAISDVQVDPAGLFEAPVRFSTGALDLRLTPRPFKLEIGQLALEEGGEHVRLSGAFGVTDAGWDSRLDVALDRISPDRLAKLWPLQLVPKTREWLVNNVQAGNLFNLNAALRAAAGTEPKFSLGYEFAGVDVRFLRSLPPIKDGYGRASVEGTRYVMALDRGHVIAPEGGAVTMDGSVFDVPDITLKPTRAAITLVTASSLTATLSLLDQPPFQFVRKAGQPVEIGQARAELVTKLTLPLIPKVKVTDVGYSAKGTLRDLVSTLVVPGRRLTARALDISVTRDGMRLSGQGDLDGAAFDVAYLQGFQPADKGKSRVEGRVSLTDAALRAFGVALPPGTLKGSASGDLTLALEKGSPGRLRITSDLVGMAVAIPALSWRKGLNEAAKLAIDVSLGPRPQVTGLTVTAPGLTAKGAVSLREGGALDVARFETLKVGNWLDASAEITGQGAARAPRLALTGGTLDLRRMPAQDQGGGDGAPLALTLDRVTASDGIALTDFRGETVNRGGLSGDFVASVNGSGRVQGTIVPGKDGSAIRIRSDDAGKVLAAAGIFASGRGGALDLVLRPRGQPGSYDGKAGITSIRVVDAPVLAELLNAISVIGILEQLNGEGLAFSSVDLDFRMEPGAVQIARGAAIGASMGVSFAGLYNTESDTLNLQGVVSPFYLLNGIGAIFTRRGEGLFGFNYGLRGKADDPQVSVNPLSILTPGMFREIFRSGPPTLRNPKG